LTASLVSLVGADQLAIGRNIGSENGSQPPFDAFPSQVVLLTDREIIGAVI
jgi:hypothetical protein